MKSMKVRITFTEPLLGTKPSDPEIHSTYVASKAPDAKTMEEEIADLGTEAVEEKGKTFAQLTADEKNAISHRGRAMRSFGEAFAEVFTKKNRG